MSETPETGESSRRWPPLIALLVLTIVLAILGGPTGAVAGLATALTWYGLETPYALAVGHVVLAAAFPNGIDPITLLFVELAFVGFLLAAVVRPASWRGDGIVVLTSAAGLVSVAWFTSRFQSLWITAGTLLVVFALGAYGLHRYELVSLGLVPDDLEPSTDSATHEQ